MLNKKWIGNLLFWLTIASLPLSFSLCATVGEVEIFSVAGIVRYSWIMLLFIPIGILSIALGNRLKKEGLKYKKLYIVALVCIPLLLIFGSYRFIFQDISYDVRDVYAIEDKIGLDLPGTVKSAHLDNGGYNICYVKITDEAEATAFLQEVTTSEKWKSQLSTMVKGLLPMDIQMEMVNFDYFVLYDLSAGTYNQHPPTDGSKYVFIAYDCELRRLIILDDYFVGTIVT